MKEEVKALVLEELKKDHKLSQDYERVITKYQTMLGIQGSSPTRQELSITGMTDEDEFRFMDERVNQKMEELLHRIKENTQKIVQEEIGKVPTQTYHLSKLVEEPKTSVDKDLIRELHATFFNEVLQTLNKKQRNFIEYEQTKARKI